MEKSSANFLKNIIVIIFFIIGAIGVMLPYTKAFFLFCTPFALLSINIYVLFLVLKEKRNLFWIILFSVVTLIIEIIGVKTGLVFGEYSYGPTLGVKIFDVPLVIGLNWVLLILSSVYITCRFYRGNLIFSSLLSSIIVTLLDVLIEPVAIKLDYWAWKDIVVPIQNYLAWFIISFLVSIFFHKVIDFNGKNNRVLNFYFVGQILFFIICNLL
ncbi:carotenoid biosynthesis protein [Candidatus Dojkabacteria bacterium]|nr:carotenoid biosynthesis protein [Candidatus Dojkabacteria bacterium]